MKKIIFWAVVITIIVCIIYTLNINFDHNSKVEVIKSNIMSDTNSKDSYASVSAIEIGNLSAKIYELQVMSHAIISICIMILVLLRCIKPSVGRELNNSVREKSAQHNQSTLSK